MVSTWVPFHITPLSPPLPLLQLTLTREANWQETETDRGQTQDRRNRLERGQYFLLDMGDVCKSMCVGYQDKIQQMQPWCQP